MLAYWFFLIFCLYILYELKEVKIETRDVGYRNRLYALRDKLREGVMEGRIDKNNWLFVYLDSSISTACGFLNWLSIWRLVIVVVDNKKNQKLKQAHKHLKQEFSKPENALLKTVHREYVDILREYLKEKHKKVWWLMTILEPRVRLRKTRELKRKYIRIHELAESPKTSTIDWFSPAYNGHHRGQEGKIYVC